MDRLRPVLLTIVALALGYGLWVLSDSVVAWSGMDHWLPIIRLATVICGLTLTDLVVSAALRRLTFLRAANRE